MEMQHGAFLSWSHAETSSKPQDMFHMFHVCRNESRLCKEMRVSKSTNSTKLGSAVVSPEHLGSCTVLVEEKRFCNELQLSF